MRPHHLRISGTIATALFLLIGCAAPMSVRYTPVASVATLGRSDSPPLRVAVVLFSDDRANPRQIGANRNAFGMDITRLETDVNMGQLLAEATTDALDKAGLDAELRTEASFGEAVDQFQSSYEAVVGGTLTLIDVETVPGFATLNGKARLSVTVEVWRRGQDTMSLAVSGEGSQGTMGMANTSALAAEALDSAMQNWVRNLIAELQRARALD